MKDVVYTGATETLNRYLVNETTVNLLIIELEESI